MLLSNIYFNKCPAAWSSVSAAVYMHIWNALSFCEQPHTIEASQSSNKSIQKYNIQCIHTSNAWQLSIIYYRSTGQSNSERQGASFYACVGAQMTPLTVI